MQVCETCQHFVQHYRMGNGGHSVVYCGHCIYPRVKVRKPDTSACEHWVQKEE